LKKNHGHSFNLTVSRDALFVIVFVVFLALGAGTSQGALRTSEAYNIESDVLSSGGSSESSSSYGNFDSFGQGAIGTAESQNYQNYGGFLETLNTSPEVPDSLAQYRSNGITSISIGEWINISIVVLKFDMYDQDSSDILTPQVEMRSTSESFTGAVTDNGADINFSGSTVEGVVTGEGLSSGTTYHWRARVRDSGMLTSPWESFGGNAETDMDFGVDMAVPQVSVITPTSGQMLYSSNTYEVTWIATEEGGSGLITGPMSIYYSTNEGSSWTTVATGELDDGSYHWYVPAVTSSTCMVSVEAEDNASNIGSDISDIFDIFNDPDSPSVPTSLEAVALPADSPSYVSLSWGASTDEAGSGVKGYNLYRSSTSGSGYTLLDGIITGTSTLDSTVVYGNNYYYVVTAIDNANNESDYSNESSAPNLKMTKEMTTEAPISGGYSGGAFDAVPGAAITYTVTYWNNGFAYATSIEVVDKVPDYTDYKMGSATSESATQINFSSDNGASYNYTPSGEYVDSNVTNIKWQCQDIPVTENATVEFKVVIE